MKINLLLKNYNPSNCPNLKPIEKLWAFLKRNTYKGRIEFKSISQLKNRTSYLLKKFDFSKFFESMKSLSLKIRKENSLKINKDFIMVMW